MVTALLFLVFVLLFLYLYEWQKKRRMAKEMTYIKEWLEKALYLKENGHILIPSDNLETKELATEINRLLDSFYAQKTGYTQSKRAMEQMLTNISHDLRTPLTVLKGYSELLCKELPYMKENKKIPEMIAKMDDKANELITTINDYFTMSKIISGDMKLEMQTVNIAQVCHEVILDYYDILDELQYRVEIQVSSTPEYVCADVEALKRILKNLIDNAVKHGGDGKYLALRLRKEAGNVVVEVEDHGKGIPHQKQEQIFYRNYTTAHTTSGSGLGLAIAKNLALQMKADIQVYSEPEVKTVFTLTLKS